MLGYNQTFHVNFDTSADKFQNYYKDLSQRVKAREVDLLIVVNMFLTGFDATTLNTLWVDKNLKMHGLIQAFSRTNRILNSVKTYGNIGAVFAARSMELWLLEDMGFAVVAKFSVNAGEGEYVTEYRVYKGSDWADSEISLDLEDLVAELAALCDPYYEHEQPIYEL